MPDTFVVDTRGIGKPDYTREISLGQIRPGIALKYNQQLMQFAIVHTDFPAGIVFPYAIPYIRPVLAPGAISHLFDLATMAPLPYTLARGYTLTLIAKSIAFNQDCDVWFFFNGLVVVNPFTVKAGDEVDIASIVGISTAQFDPTGAGGPYLIDVQVVNRGLQNMRGGVNFNGILEKIL